MTAKKQTLFVYQIKHHSREDERSASVFERKTAKEAWNKVISLLQDLEYGEGIVKHLPKCPSGNFILTISSDDRWLLEIHWPPSESMKLSSQPMSNVVQLKVNDIVIIDDPNVISQSIEEYFDE